MKTFKGFIIGLIIGIVATFAFAYTCMDSYFAMVMEKIHNVVQVFDNNGPSGNTSSSVNYDDLTIDEKVALLDEGEASTDDELMASLSIKKDEILTQDEELYYVVISYELSAVHLNYIELMEQNPDMPKIYYYYDENHELSPDGYYNICDNVTDVNDLQCMYSMITVRNNIGIECTNFDEGKDLDSVEVYDLKIKEIYRNYLENKKDS